MKNPSFGWDFACSQRLVFPAGKVLDNAEDDEEYEPSLDPKSHQREQGVTICFLVVFQRQRPERHSVEQGDEQVEVLIAFPPAPLSEMLVKNFVKVLFGSSLEGVRRYSHDKSP